MSQSSAATHLRSLYRSLLRELPPSTPKTLSSSSSVPSSLLRHRIRTSFTTPEPPRDSAAALHRRHEAEQFLQYIRAQRVYTTLLERYNPGMSVVDDEERIRLTARRVGMEMPREWYEGRNSGGE